MTTVRHLRRAAVIGLAAAAATTPTTAMASPPTHQPPSGTVSSLHLADDEVPCGPITITYDDHERYSTFYDADGSARVTIVTGQLLATVTSDVTGRSVDLQISGPGKAYPDGSLTGGGPWLLFDSDVLAYAAGRITIPVSGPNDFEVRGTRLDLCPIINP